VQSLKSGKRKELFPGDTARYIPTGHIIYARDNDLFAIPFDLDKLEATGGTVSIVEGVFRAAAPQYAVSDSGTLVYVPGRSAAVLTALVWVDRKGKEVPLSAVPKDYRFARISPDGTKVALTIDDNGKRDIWIWDIVRETMSRLTFDEHSAYAIWTPDGRRIAFAKRGAAVATLTDLYWKAADGTGEEEKLGSGKNRELLPWSWSGDRNTLALFEVDDASGFVYDIGTVSIKGNHEWRPLLNQKYNECQPKISPEGNWMAYTSDESGRYEIYVRAFPDVNKGRWQVSTSGGATPLWSPDGRELFYRNDDAVMRVSIETEPTFKAGKPETLFRGTYIRLPTANATYDAQPWDIHPDGKRFLMLKPSPSTSAAPTAEAPRRINIVVNWFEELKQRVPSK
jgi:serine/threonine-protein kinase